jgi:SAM-dependent methyltransferase
MTQAGGRAHWDAIWQERDPTDVSWYQPDPRRSVELITAHASPAEPVIDVGAGSSSVIDILLDAGFTDLTALDISEAALAVGQRRLGTRAERVQWITADVLACRFERRYRLWHDRAVFHFLVDPGDRVRYVAQLESALVPGGHLVLATFGPQGPETCSGLPVQRYGEAGMSRELGARFTLRSYAEEEHATPAGAAQLFAFGVFRFEVPA